MITCECGAPVPHTGPELGRHYGYPVCCVTAFLIREVRYFRGLYVREVDHMTGTGFVPCRRHECVPAALLVTEIEGARACGVPFAVSVAEARADGDDGRWVA